MKVMEISFKRVLFMFLFIFLLLGFGEGKVLLKKDFYRSTCPHVEKIVRQVVTTKMSQTFITVPGTLHLFFHDCFVTGCDASVLIFSPNNDAEKDAPDNLSLAGDGFDTVIKAKHAIESQCPGIVSCADILAIAARDVVTLTGGPNWEVELGRRDGLISKASLVAGNLPQPNFNLAQLTKLFAKHNLSQTDMIALSGAHTLGFSHCDRISDRLYPLTETDPTLNQSYAQQLMQQCPKNADPRIAVQMDPVTPQTFDNMYYKNLIQRMGMFKSDDVLFSDPDSNPTVMSFAAKPGDFAVAFVAGMRKLGRVGVKTGKQGEVRRDCSAFNS